MDFMCDLEPFSEIRSHMLFCAAERLAITWTKRYFTVKNIVQQELKEVDYLGLTTDMWTSRANDG